MFAETSPITNARNWKSLKADKVYYQITMIYKARIKIMYRDMLIQKSSQYTCIFYNLNNSTVQLTYFVNKKPFKLSFHSFVSFNITQTRRHLCIANASVMLNKITGDV